MANPQEVVKAGMEAFDAEVESWMPKGAHREKLTAYVKWREGIVEKSTACRTQADAGALATRLLARPDIPEIFLVLHVKKVR